ncbi:hypothetical protein BDA96_05G073200 [Sorghum bicolor]|uniref:Uncharacterized protein n=1 Tax=Sorghum bicolor TaxID=4558 RepID=A0A921QXX9_SORBI|nr:hypothetical protein BDA96_05G073200 [Sorghum bicolor]
MAPPAGRCDHAAAASRRRSARLAAQRTSPAPPTAVAPPAPRTTTTPCRRRRRLPLHFRRSDNQACLVSNLAHHQVVFVEAWPGTGRSSQVPRVLHAAGHGPVVCSQTYRIAAESAAAHAATNMRAGETRPPARPLHLLAADPLLARYGAVVVDEADDGMLLTAAVLSCVKAVVARRPELRLVICIHGTMFYGEGAINDFFPDAVHLWFRTMLGVLRFHDFLTEPVPVTDYVAASVHTVCSIHSGEPPGDVLVFLPTPPSRRSGTAGTRHARCLHDGLAVVDLIGDVLSPAPDGKRKVVLANDVANSAVFVEGIKYIVDSGYLCTDNALPSLTTTAGASSPPAAAQMVRALKVAVRSGYHIKRRGNEAKCFCLYTTAECRGMLRTCWSSLRARTNDANGIAGVVLVLKHLGIISGSIESFNFVLPPRPETLERAVEVLEAAGAVG